MRRERRKQLGRLAAWVGMAGSGLVAASLHAACGGRTPAGGEASKLTGDSSVSGDTWIYRTAGTSAWGLPWEDVASDSTGTHLVAVTGFTGYNPDGNIWTSTDSGATWTNRTQGTAASGLRWLSVASDSTGAHLVAITSPWSVPSSGASVWTSSDTGATWTQRTTISSTARLEEGTTVVSDSTGTRLIVAAGDVWTSTDSGATWTDVTSGTPLAAQTWVDMAADSTAEHLVAADASGDIWTSSDSGATWTNRTQGTAASGLDWQAVASDSTGTHLIVAAGDIWTYTDSGATWTNRTQGTTASGHSWTAVASDSTGAHLVAAASLEDWGKGMNDIWTSSDSGETWTDATEGTSAADLAWVAVACNASGSHIVAVNNGGPGSRLCCQGNVWTN